MVKCNAVRLVKLYGDAGTRHLAARGGNSFTIILPTVSQEDLAHKFQESKSKRVVLQGLTRSPTSLSATSIAYVR